MKFTELRENMSGAREIGAENTPPAMMILRRRGIRLFPDGQRVAMYTNDRYKLMFTVPFGNSYLGLKAGSPLMATQTEGVAPTSSVNSFLVQKIAAKFKSKFGTSMRKKNK